ncbi:MAG: 2-hydroxymuconate tautomerase, partial [Leptotrichiaceae bacterium]
NMPVITIKLLEGRTDEQIKEMIKEVTEVVSRTVDAKPETISISVEEMRKDRYAVAGIRISDR